MKFMSYTMPLSSTPGMNNRDNNNNVRSTLESRYLPSVSPFTTTATTNTYYTSVSPAPITYSTPSSSYYSTTPITSTVYNASPAPSSFYYATSPSTTTYTTYTSSPSSYYSTTPSSQVYTTNALPLFSSSTVNSQGQIIEGIMKKNFPPVAPRSYPSDYSDHQQTQSTCNTQDNQSISQQYTQHTQHTHTQNNTTQSKQDIWSVGNPPPSLQTPSLKPDDLQHLIHTLKRPKPSPFQINPPSSQSLVSSSIVPIPSSLTPKKAPPVAPRRHSNTVPSLQEKPTQTGRNLCSVSLLQQQQQRRPSSHQQATSPIQAGGSTLFSSSTLKPSSNTQFIQHKLPPPQQQQQPQGRPLPQPKAKPNQVRALWDCQAEQEGDLEFKCGDIITVLKRDPSGWWVGQLGDQRGNFPANYVSNV